MPDSDTDSNVENYLELLNSHERVLSAYVHTLVHNHADAEDILQASRLTMWKKFSDFEPGTNFVAWARKIALHQILNYRRSQGRKPAFSSDPAFIEAIAGEIDRQCDQLTERSEALKKCLKKLPEAQRKMILFRYYEGCDIAEVASKTGRTEGAAYRLLSRIRKTLNECVSQQTGTAAS
ncbi:MAG: sigma-70 family RNA polymerase sigma factor [Verrucomicrobiales bacterium]|nr:sigma-70 family RNA polymerase sigma factor [Verrucomicrobiales bacterium]